MLPLIYATIFLYMLSSAAYMAYLFFQKNHFQRSGYYILLAGFAVHSAAVGYEFFQAGGIPVRNLYETLVVAAWTIAAAYLIFQYRYNLKILGIYAAPLAALVLIIASQYPHEMTALSPIYKSVWLIIHVVFIFIGEAAFALACGLGMLYLLQEHALKTKRYGFFFKRLPALERLDTSGYACIVVGFSLLTIGLVTGFIYARTTWGRFWSWDPKEVWSGITWLLYAALFHGRLSLGWRGRKSALMAIAGFVVLLFTFVGVNFLLTGHHGQFTRW